MRPPDFGTVVRRVVLLIIGLGAFAIGRRDTWPYYLGAGLVASVALLQFTERIARWKGLRVNAIPRIIMWVAFAVIALAVFFELDGLGISAVIAAGICMIEDALSKSKAARSSTEDDNLKMEE